MKITLVSDIICPWCYIGKTRLQNAIEALQIQDRIQIEVSPYQLYPDIPIEGRHRSQFPKKAGHGSLLKEAGEQLGISFNWHQIEVIPNTLAIHEALFGLAKEVRWEAKTALFKAYFTDGKPLHKAATVQEVLEPYQKVLMDSELSISQLIAANQNRGISAVPSYIVDDEHILKGAIEEERWKAFFKRRLGL